MLQICGYHKQTNPLVGPLDFQWHCSFFSDGGAACGGGATNGSLQGDGVMLMCVMGGDDDFSILVADPQMIRLALLTQSLKPLLFHVEGGYTR